MATAFRTLISKPPPFSLTTLSPLFSLRPFSSKSISLPLLLRPTSLLRLRPLVSLAEAKWSSPVIARGSGVKCFSTRATTSSLNDPSPNWSNRPPKETILLDGCDFEHWLVVMEPPEGNPTRDEIIDSYIKTLAQIVGSEEEARQKIYSVSTRHYFAFGALVSEELSYKIKPLPRVRWVLPDSFLDVKNKDYGGEPFINGQAVPYDPKYHEEWVRNNARANERSRRNDRPRNFDRSRNFERRRENMQNHEFQPRDAPPMPNQGFQNSGVQNTMPPRDVPPQMPNQDGQSVMPPSGLPPMPNRDGQNVIPPNAQYSNSNPGTMPNPAFQGRAGPNFGGAPNRDYQNQVPNYQNNYMPNRDGGNMQGGGNAYQGGSGSHQGSGNAYQGGSGSHQGSGNAYQGGSGAYQGSGNAYQGGGGPGYPGPNPSYQGGGGGSYVVPNNAFQGGGNAGQGRDMPGRD